jgi:hypothetical protein
LAPAVQGYAPKLYFFLPSFLFVSFSGLDFDPSTQMPRAFFGKLRDAYSYMDAEKAVHTWIQQRHLDSEVAPWRSWPFNQQERIVEALHRKFSIDWSAGPPHLSDFFFPAFSGNILYQSRSCLDFRLFFFYLSLAVVERCVSITPGDYACLHCTTTTQVPENMAGKFSPTPASTFIKFFFPQ